MNSIHVITGLKKGGAETVLLKLLSSLKQFGGQHLVIYFEDGVFVDSIQNQQIKLLKAPINIFKLFGFLWTLKSKIPFTPDIIQGWMYHGNILALMVQKCIYPQAKLLWNIRQSLHTFKSEKPRTKFFIYLNVVFSYFTDSIICNSKEAIQHHLELGFYDRFYYIPNGFKVEPQSQEQLKNKWQGKSTFRVINVGRFHNDKGQDLLVKAAVLCLERGLNLEFIFVGRDMDQLKSMIPPKFVTKFTFTGEVSNVDDYLNQAHIFVSSSRAEAFSNALGEAMAQALIPIATNVGDSKSMVERVGVLIPPNDVREIEKAILQVYSLSESEKLKRSREAQEHIQKFFSWSEVFNKYVQHYQFLIGE